MDAITYLKEKARLTRCGEGCCDLCRLDSSNTKIEHDCGET